MISDQILSFYKKSNKNYKPLLINYDIILSFFLRLLASANSPAFSCFGPPHFFELFVLTRPNRTNQIYCAVLIIIIKEQMEGQSQARYSSRISVQSRKSQLSSCRSLQRPSWSQKDHSLSKNRSFIEVMSIQSSRKSDLYDKLLAEATTPPDHRKSNPQSTPFNPFKTSMKPINQEPKRFSYEQSTEIDHICLCYLKCNAETCPCYEAVDDCVDKLCCKECIEAKILRKQRASEEEYKERTFCTCKKTKCNKKYCSCFAAGLKCGVECNCEDCQNCDKVEKMEVEPVCIVDPEIQIMKMPQSMEFQPFSFRYSYNS